MKNKRVSYTTEAVIIISVLLLSVNAVLGGVLLSRSRQLTKTLINERMLDISNTAAAMLDGDVVQRVTVDDKGTPPYEQAMDTLRVFQENIELEFIYCVRATEDGEFIFIMDPAVENASEFGELVHKTEALLTASRGTSAVDEVPYEDAWGKFYSAYSPVFNSAGAVAGVVAVDFRADWYDAQFARSANTVLLFSLLSLFVGAAVVFVITSRLRGRLRAVSSDLSALTDDVDELLRELGTDGDADAASAQTGAGGGGSGRNGDEVGELAGKIHSMRDHLRSYFDHMHAQANSMITALASDYRSVYYIDLDADEGVCYRAHSHIDNGLGEGEHFSFREVFTSYAERYVAESDRAEFLRIIDPENIRRELEKESIVAHRYLVVKNGQESYEMLRMAGVRHPEDRTDHMVHAVGVGFTDVDKETRETLAQQQALSDALALAEDANRAKTAFLSSMSHEIRTPMNAIIGLDSIALSDPDISENTRDHLEKIGASARHLLGLINDILDMSRIESGRMTLRNEEFSFRELLTQINTMVDSQCCDKGLTYECRTDEDLADYYIGDSMKLKQVLINILGNAVKFTPEGGSVTFAVERTAHFEGRSTLRFTMRDTGIGMDKSFLPKLFDAFSQEDSSTTNKYGSTGLGMAISKNIVEMMNGKIEVESEKGVGTTFTVTVTLPDSERRAEDAADFRPQGIGVLIVDDDPVACEHARLVLEEAGISSELASSGAEAVEMVKLRHARRETYDLILVDWKMPEMDGVETTRRIRAILGDEAAIIILTAYQWDDVLEKALDVGVNSFIAKPLTAPAILDEFRKALDRQGAAPESRKADLAGRRVLLAEDMPINAEIMKDILAMREIEVDHAENGREAVELFAAHPEGWYDAILMDMRMPEMDGLEATSAIRSMARADAGSVPIIALTANAFDDDVQRSLQAGLNAHLSKPVEPESLFSTLESLIR